MSMNTNPKKILIIDDDAINARIIAFYLEQDDNFVTRWAKNATEAVSALADCFDLILLDIMLPDVNGVSLCTTLRQYTNCPIIFISCIDDENTMVEALETGGDDYLVKPFSKQILLARVNANFRRIELEHRKDERKIIEFPSFTLIPADHTLSVRGEAYHLSSIELGILLYFTANPNKTIPLEDIYRAVWGAPSHGDVRTVVSHVYNLRQKIEKDAKRPRIIRSVRGYGYIFSPFLEKPEN